MYLLHEYVGWDHVELDVLEETLQHLQYTEIAEHRDCSTQRLQYTEVAVHRDCSTQRLKYKRNLVDSIEKDL